MFDYNHNGKTVFRPKIRWAERPHIYPIIYDPTIDEEEMKKNLNVGKDASEEHRKAIEKLIIKY